MCSKVVPRAGAGPEAAGPALRLLLVVVSLLEWLFLVLPLALLGRGSAETMLEDTESVGSPRLESRREGTVVSDVRLP